MKDDTISRQAAIDALSKLMVPYGDGSYPGDNEKMAYDESIVDAIHEIENLPKVQPKRGKWIPVTNGRGGHECDQCHNYAPSYANGTERLSDFCPDCGADMRCSENPNS